MEKLFIVYKDKGRLIVSCKKKGAAMNYFNGLPKSGMQTAYVQKYPKKDNPPIMLVEEGMFSLNK